MIGSILCLTLALTDAAAADKTRYIAAPTNEGTWVLDSALWLADTSVVTDASDYRTIAIKNGATTLGSLTTNSTGGAAWTAGTSVPFTLSGANKRELVGSATSTLSVDSTHTGSTGKVADGRILLAWKRIA